MRIIPLLAVLALLPLALTGGDCEYRLDIPLQQPSLAVLEISVEALICLGGRPETLRLWDGQGQRVPWLREQLQDSRVAFGLNACPSRAELVTEREDGSLEMHFQLEEKALQPTGISIQTSIRNFEQQVQICAWDGQEWQNLLRDGLIFESSRTLSLKNVDLEFESGKFRKFRVVVSQASLDRQAPLRSVQRSWGESGQASGSEKLQVEKQSFKIDAVRFWQRFSYDAAAGPCWLYPESAALQIEPEPKQRQTVISLQPQCYPVQGLKIHCREKNFSRQIRVYQLTAAGELLLARERIWALDLPGQKKDSREIHFPAVEHGKLKIYCEDGDNPPLQYQSVNTITPAWGLYFFVEPDGLPYRLTAAPDEAEPRYDNGQIIREARQRSTPVIASLLSQQGTPLSARTAPRESKWGRLGLILALLICAGSLGFGIYKAARKTAGEEE